MPALQPQGGSGPWLALHQGVFMPTDQALPAEAAAVSSLPCDWVAVMWWCPTCALSAQGRRVLIKATLFTGPLGIL